MQTTDDRGRNWGWIGLLGLLGLLGMRGRKETGYYDRSTTTPSTTAR
jgi:MYXO-CTERM domain-containing protein